VKTIHRHISGDYLVTFVMTLLVFTFVMCIGVIFKASDLLARGVPWGPVLLIILYGFPTILSFSIPISVMTSSLLVFGRLSSDGEITAMRACGISLWEIASRPLMFALLFSVVCLYINSELSPRSHFKRKTLKAELGVETVLEVLDEGRFIRDFSGYTIFLGRKNANHIENVRIYDATADVKREIFAKSGVVSTDESGENLVLTLYDARIDPIQGSENDTGHCKSYRLLLPNAVKKAKYDKRDEDLMLGEILVRIENTQAFYPDLNEEDLVYMEMALRVEFNKRLVLALSCFSFMLLGIPLGIRSHRKESSIGIAIGLFLFLNFYLFILVAEELANRPQLRPDLIVWAPVIISVLLASRLIRRAS
jgi:lipopolysaccharide export system permease protein